MTGRREMHGARCRGPVDPVSVLEGDQHLFGCHAGEMVASLGSVEAGAQQRPSRG